VCCNISLFLIIHFLFLNIPTSPFLLSDVLVKDVNAVFHFESDH